MKKINLLLLFCCNLFLVQGISAQCTPVNCLSNLPPYGGICDSVLATGRVGTPYSDTESFHTTTACFDAGLISPANAGTGIRITVVDNFTFSGFPGGLTPGTNQTSYTAPANGCIGVTGTPTTAGVFADTVKFLADVVAYPFGGGACVSFSVNQNNNNANYVLRQTILPNPNFTIPRTTFCTNNSPVALSLVANATTGGTFSGPGVTGTNFNPATAGPGTHVIKYRVTAQQGAAIAPATDSFMITVTVTNAVTATTNATNETCASGGTATATPASGTTPYSYVWSNGATNASINGLGAGTYSVTVTDAAGCSASSSSIVTSNVVTLNTSSPTITDSNCGVATGAISISATNGSAPYTYMWSNGATTQTINNIAAGSYSVTVTDANSCTGIVSNIIVSNPNSPSANISSSTDVLCNGATTGAATVSASGGTVTSGYTYNWSNGANTAANNNLAAGTYTVTVTDNANCVAVTAVTITEPSALMVNADAAATNNILCNGASTGAAGVTVSGGVPNYTYNWSNSANTAAITNLSAGVYVVTVTDNNGCNSVFATTISQPSNPLTLTPSSTNISCNGAGNGTAAVSVTGGTPIYTYNWSNGGNTSGVNFLQAGTYTVTVTDANACTATIAAFTITEPSALSVSSNVTDASAFGASDGAIDVSVSGGSGSYTYNWSNGATTQDLNGVAAGTYSVTITDGNGCSFIENGTVDQPSAVEFNDANISLQLYPNPADASATLSISLNNSSDVNIEITNVVGQVIDSINDANVLNSQYTLNTSNWAAGIYFVRVTAGNNRTTIRLSKN